MDLSACTSNPAARRIHLRRPLCARCPDSGSSFEAQRLRARALRVRDETNTMMSLTGQKKRASNDLQFPMCDKPGTLILGRPCPPREINSERSSTRFPRWSGRRTRTEPPTCSTGACSITPACPGSKRAIWGSTVAIHPDGVEKGEETSSTDSTRSRRSSS